MAFTIKGGDNMKLRNILDEIIKMIDKVEGELKNGKNANNSETH